MTQWFPDTIAARFALTIVISLIIFHEAGVGLVYLESFVHNVPDARSEYMLPARIADITQIVDATPANIRADIIDRLNRPALGVAIRQTLQPDVHAENGPRFLELRRRILAGLDAAPHQIIIGKRDARDSTVAADTIPESAPLEPDELSIEVALSDGHWLGFRAPDDFLVYSRTLRFAKASGAFGVVIALLSIWAARRLAAPIADFGRAAGQLGVDGNAPPLAERGPRELRGATRAFNRMQQRLQRFIQDRMQMLAAMSHDLRTPLLRLRLRAEFIEDEEQKRKMLADLDAMSVMIESTLAFAREESQLEPRVLVDLGVLVENVCENALDAGGAVTCCAPRGLDVTCRPTALTRAIANLVDNAVKYGGAARVHLSREAGRVMVVIEDDGPGVPMDKQEMVFAPFYRLENSRNPDTGGAGLGLSVARTIARAHGGDVTLANRKNGGLRVCMELPA